ncbi:hypothetical protein ACS0TY_004052 [Phlomoides rotata]
MENLLSDLNLGHDEDEELVFEEERNEQHPENSNLFVVGQFLTETTYNFSIMCSRMAAIWKSPLGCVVLKHWRGPFLGPVLSYSRHEPFARGWSMVL